MGNWNKVFLKSISTLAIVFAGIQLASLIAPASQSKFWAFVIPLGALILAIFLQHWEED
jgi:hypothetical protein